MHLSEQSQKHAICVVFVHKPSVWSVNAEQRVFTSFSMFYASILAHTRNGHNSFQKMGFLMHLSEQCQEHAICVDFVHKLIVWCVLCKNRQKRVF